MDIPGLTPDGARALLTLLDDYGEPGTQDDRIAAAIRAALEAGDAGVRPTETVTVRLPRDAAEEHYKHLEKVCRRDSNGTPGLVVLAALRAALEAGEGEAAPTPLAAAMLKSHQRGGMYDRTPTAASDASACDPREGDTVVARWVLRDGKLILERVPQDDPDDALEPDPAPLDVANMRSASYLLPDPGGEVVRQLLDELQRERATSQMRLGQIQSARARAEQTERERDEAIVERDVLACAGETDGDELDAARRAAEALAVDVLRVVPPETREHVWESIEHHVPDAAARARIQGRAEGSPDA